MKRIARMLALGLIPTVVAGVITGLAGAQQQSPAAPGSVDVTSPEPSPKAPGIRLERTMPLEQRGPRDNDYYPGYNVKSEHDPAFVEPFVKTIPTSRTSGVKVGLSGWTAPALPYDIPQAGGGVAFGITFSWFVPLPPPSAAPAPEGAPPR